MLIFLHEGALNRNAYEYCGIKFLKKKFKLKIFNISKLFIKDFDKILKKYKNSICFEIGYDFRSFLLRLKIKKYNSLLASVYALTSYPADAYNNLGQGDKIGSFFQKLKRRFKLLSTPNIFFYKLVNFIVIKLRFFYHNDIVFHGGTESYKYLGFNSAKYKIYASSLDYGVYLKNKKKIKKLYKKKYALFIDTYFPFHPDNKHDTNLFISSSEYFRKLEFFFREFEKVTKLKIIIALHPKADLKKYPAYIKKFKIIRNQTVALIKYAKLVLQHGSTAQSFAIIYKKPLIFLTSDQMLKYEFIFNHNLCLNLLGSKLINVEDIDYKFLSNKKKLFYFNKSLYRNYFSKYLKHPKSPNKPWYEIFYDFTTKKTNLFS